MADQEKPQTADYADTLRQHFGWVQKATQSPEMPRFKMSTRNQRKLELIRQKVRELRGGL